MEDRFEARNRAVLRAGRMNEVDALRGGVVRV
jgi:hypothetical protein